MSTDIGKDGLKIGERIWNDLNESLKGELWKVYAILAEAHTLFAQAVTSFDAGVNEGAVLLCRATVESAFFLFLTREWNEKGQIGIENPTTLDGRMRTVEFAELSNAIKKRVRFSVKQSNAIDRIRNDGNFVAHFASRRAKELQRYSEEMTRVHDQISKTNLSPDDRIKAYNKVAENFKFWIGPQQALDALRDTSSILLTMFNSM
jgi:hypothetical protein